MAPVIFKEEPVKKLMNEHVANIKKKYEGKIDGKDQATLIRERYIGSLEALHAYKPLVMDFLKIRLALRQLDGNLRGVMREQKRATKRIGKFRKGQYSSMRLRGTQVSHR